MKGLIWNCRGLNNPTAPIIPKIKNLVGNHSPDFVFLMETKRKKKAVFNKFRSFGFSYWGGMDAVGTSGGDIFWVEKEESILNSL